MKPCPIWTPLRLEAIKRGVSVDTIRSRYDRIPNRERLSPAEIRGICFRERYERRWAGKTSHEWASAIKEKYGWDMPHTNVYQNFRKWVIEMGFTEEQAVHKLDDLVRRRIKTRLRQEEEAKHEAALEAARRGE